MTQYTIPILAYLLSNSKCTIESVSECRNYIVEVTQLRVWKFEPLTPSYLLRALRRFLGLHSQTLHRLRP